DRAPPQRPSQERQAVVAMESLHALYPNPDNLPVCADLPDSGRRHQARDDSALPEALQQRSPIFYATRQRMMSRGAGRVLEGGVSKARWVLGAVRRVLHAAMRHAVRAMLRASLGEVAHEVSTLDGL